MQPPRGSGGGTCTTGLSVRDRGGGGGGGEVGRLINVRKIQSVCVTHTYHLDVEVTHLTWWWLGVCVYIVVRSK